ncbi:MAG: N-6 DNA methylase [Candidatus Omnitrophica bacterium]|nr:N-6 DNA methylase [Candidatus Omnitrophota bacterium]
MKSKTDFTKGDQEENLNILKNLHSEEDVKSKIVIPYFKKLGYKDGQIFLNVPIKAFLGRQSKTVYADLVVKDGSNPIIIVEVKKPGIQLNEIHKEQAISYARQSEKVVPIAVVTNGISYKIYDVKTKQQVPEIPKKSELISFLANIKISKEEIEEAGRFIIEGYKNVQEIKVALDKCHDIIRSNDGLDPLSSFDEVNKLIFAKIQEEHRSNSRFTKEFIKDNPVVEINRIFQDANAIFKSNRIFGSDEKIKLKAATIVAIVSILEHKAISKTKDDLIGLAYESFLPSIFRGERLGQFFTPDRIKEFMIEILDPRVGNLILDPAFGSGGFLVLSYKRLLEGIKSSSWNQSKKDEEKLKLSSEYLYGIEINPRLEIACKTNMYLHGDGRTRIYRGDGLLNTGEIQEGKFDIVVTNPPFGAKVDNEEILNKFELGIKRNKQKSEILFLERCVRLAKPETGRIGIVLPESVLMNTQCQPVRDWLDHNVIIDAIFKMPSYAFSPSGAAGIQTSLVFMTRKKPTSFDYKIFMGNVNKISFDANNRPDADHFPNAAWHYREFKAKNKEMFDDDNYYVIKRSDGELLSVNFYKPKYLKLLKKIKKEKHLKLEDILKKDKYSIVDGPFGTQLHVSDYKTKGIPVLRVKNIGINEFINKDLVYISKDKHKELTRSRVQKGDIIIAKTGATFGKACLFPDSLFLETNITASCCKISVDPKKANPYFIAELLNSQVIYSQLERYSQKAAQPGFNMVELRKIIIPDIPLGKQNQIANSIRKRKELIKKLELQINSESSMINEEIENL